MSKRCRSSLGLLFLILTGGLPLFAQSADLMPPIFEIRSVEIEAEGRTRHWALEDLLVLRAGHRFAGEAALVRALADQQQIFRNRRELESAELQFAIGAPVRSGAATLAYQSRFGRPDPVPDIADVMRAEAQTRAAARASGIALPAVPTVVQVQAVSADEVLPVDVRVQVRDTWNLIALPYAKYDSNTGLLLSIRIRDYNFFGTLQELKIDLDYERTESDENVVSVGMNFSLPFNVLRQRWLLHLDQSVSLIGDEVDFDMMLGLGYEFVWLSQRWEARYSQGFRYLTDDEKGDGQYYTSRTALITAIATPLSVPGFGRLDYGFEPYLQTMYKPGGISAERDGLDIGLDHGLKMGRADWRGNYRNGQTARITHNIAYDTFNNAWSSELTGSVALYRSLFQTGSASRPRAGLSTRIAGFYLMDGAEQDQDDAAADARGVLNDRMNGDLGLFLNTDMAFTVWTLRPLFEAQVAGFFDVAMVRDTRGDFYAESAFDSERDLKFGGGIEVIGFPLFARSLYVRASYGVDLRAVLKEGTSPFNGRIREIFIGLGHHY